VLIGGRIAAGAHLGAAVVAYNSAQTIFIERYRSPQRRTSPE
jgi:hypothetical protein